MQKKIDILLWMTLVLLSYSFPSETYAQGKKCPKAENLEATDITDHSAKLAWQGHEDILSYQVDVKHGPGEKPFSYSVNVEVPEAMVEGLSPGTMYRYRVMTKCDPASGGSSTWYEFTTTGEQTTDSTGMDTTETTGPQPAGPCPKPSNLAILEINDTAALLGWLGNEENLIYQVDVHQRQHTPQYRLSEKVDTTVLWISGLTPGGNYAFRVKARCEKSSSGSSSWINFTTMGGDTAFQFCPKPTNLSVLEVTDSSALLKWVARDSISHFQLDVKSYQGTTPFDFTTSLVADSFWISGLVPGGYYQFRVFAFCSDSSQSGSSDWSKFRTLSDSSGLDTTELEIPEEDPELESEEEMEEEEENEEEEEEGEPEENQSGISEAVITAFPNPAVEQINIELPVEELGFLTQISLTDMFGRIVYQTSIQGQPSEKNLPLPVSALRNGIYKLIIKSVDFQQSKTILVQH